MSPAKCLVLGFGSDALSDDGLPVRLVADLQKIFNEESCNFITSPVGGMELIHLLEGYDEAILIDTQSTSRRAPGEISEFTPAHFEETLHLSSQHDLSFENALHLAEVMRIRMPSQIRIFAIEISENKLLSFEFSAIIQSRYPSILSYLCRVLKNRTGKENE